MQKRLKCYRPNFVIEALESGMCDVIKIPLKRKDGRRSGKKIPKKEIPSLLFRRIFVTSHIILYSASLLYWYWYHLLLHTYKMIDMVAKKRDKKVSNLPPSLWVVCLKPDVTIYKAQVRCLQPPLLICTYCTHVCHNH